MNETLVKFGDGFVKGHIYNPDSRENRLRRIEDEMESVATKISIYHGYLESLRFYANKLLGKNTASKQTHRIRVEDSKMGGYELLLEYHTPQFIPKDARLMIKPKDRLVWSPVSRVQFFKMIRSCKEVIRNLDREYGRLAKHYNEVKESKEDRKAELLEIKEIKLKELALIEEELKNIE